MLNRSLHLSRLAPALAFLIGAALIPATGLRAELFSSAVYSVQPLKTENERTTSIAFSPDAAFIAWAASGDEANGEIVNGEAEGAMYWGYDDNGLKWTRVLDTNADGAFVAFSPDSRFLAAASPLVKPKKGSTAGATLDMLSTVLDDSLPRSIVQAPKLLWEITLPKYSVFQIAFSPDNSVLAGICNDRNVRIWKVANGKLMQTLNVGRDIKALAYAPNGELLITCGAKLKGEMQRWNPASAKMVRKTDVGASFESLFINGDNLLTSDAKGVVTFWNAATSVKIKTLTMAGSATSLQAVSPDGSLLAGFVAGETLNDLVLAQWNSETGALYLSYSSNRGPLRPVAYSSDTKHIATGGVGGTAPNVDHDTLHIWPVTSLKQ